MISVKQAQSILSEISCHWGAENIPFEQCDGRFLAEDILTDRDFPSFDRAMMDGFAIRWVDWQKGQRTFQYQHQQWAGSPLISLQGYESCEITTGAAVPNGFDVVIPVEKIKLHSNGSFECRELDKIKTGWNIQKQGSEFKCGEIALKKGTLITPAVKAVLASCGVINPMVFKQPSIGIVSTGDELVPVDQSPLPHQIRTSNAHALKSLVLSFSQKIDIFHLNDNPDEILEWLEKHATQFDVLLFSGGVSKGGKDYLPQLWQQSGFQNHFHGILQKPGKPMWLGSKNNTVLFGFPGNPVSTLTCAIAYLMPWIRQQWSSNNNTFMVQLSERIEKHEQLDLWIPVVIKNNSINVLAYKGSGDLIGFSKLSGILHIPSQSVVNIINEDYRYYPCSIL